MANPNNLNTAKGRAFQNVACSALSKHFGKQFTIERAIAIGNPAKEHKFDIASTDGTIIVETKSYSWTDGTNVPAAKMVSINEAVFYLQFLGKNVIQRLVVLALERNPRSNVTIAEYYHRANRHLLNGVEIWEYDDVQQIFRKF